jgi:UDP-N-acetylglucosamine 2-epimerase (non-hydrolysing)
MEHLLKRVKPTLVLVEGDTNGVLATALASVKLGIPVGHVEAELRSFDLRMPEEHNRRLTDHVSTYLFAPTKTAENNLRRESVWGKIHTIGNTVTDAVMQYGPVAEKKSKIMEEIRFEKFALATAHRAENVDNPTVLRNLVEAFMEAPIPVVYPSSSPHTEEA